MAIAEIVREIKTLSSRQVLVVAFFGSLLFNYKQYVDKELLTKQYLLSEAANQKVREKLSEADKKRTDDTNKKLLDFTKEQLGVGYEKQNTIDSLELVLKFERKYKR